MAMILDALASSLSEQLVQMMKDEAAMLLCASRERERLRDTLNSIKKFLDSAEKRNITEDDEYVQDWVRKLKDIMYDATDILDIVHLKAEQRRASSPGCSNSTSSLLLCLQDPLFSHRIKSRIKALNQKMEDLSKLADLLKFLGHLDVASYSCRPHQGSYKTAPGILQQDIMGDKIEQDKRMLVEILTKDSGSSSRSGSSSNVMVVAILGVGGIGKTTLAKKIFNDETVKATFDTKIWLSVTKDFNEADLLRTAIIVATDQGLREGRTEGGQKPYMLAAGNQEKSVLEPALVEVLRNKKVLLVMDDVWTEKVWDDVLRIPTIEAAAPGSRVLVTTRNQQVAQGMKVAHLHHVAKLGLQDAWTLLKKQVDLSESEIGTLEEYGLKIAQKCDGLPLAIKLIGGVLFKKGATRNNWEEVLDNYIWSKTGLREELNKAIYLSYEDLHPNLKQCFVFYSLFPKDEKIGVDKIVSMWIAEGFIRKDEYSSQEGTDSTKLAMDYYNELIMRNLLEPQDEYHNQEHCIMHDVVRSFAQYVARDEALVVAGVQNISNLNSSKIYRLSITANEVGWSDLQKHHSLRTVLLFGNIKLPRDFVRTFPCLRTMHVRNADLSAMKHSLYHLKHLRYLELMNTNISSLPSYIGNMKFLEHIGLHGCHLLRKLPGSIVQLNNLRYLSIDETGIESIPSGFSRLKNLEVLWGFPIHNSMEDTEKHSFSLEEIGSLSQLRILKLKGLQNVASGYMATLAKLGSKNKLTLLELWCTSRLGTNGEVKDAITTVQQEQIKGVFDELCPPSCLEGLTVGGYFGDILPRWLKMPAASLQNLRRLYIKKLACCVQLPDGLGQLPNLDRLVIHDAPCIERIGHDLFFEEIESVNIASNRAAFTKLHHLYIQGMMEWKEWTWEEHVEAMPILNVLNIENCKLCHLPPGLPYQARSLERLSLVNVQYLNSVENFSSVIELEVFDNPQLERIVNLPNMQDLTIVHCPNLKLLQGVSSIRIIHLGDYDMKTLPEYLRHIKLWQLEFVCSLKLLWLMSSMTEGWSEWEKISHNLHVKGYAKETVKGIASKNGGGRSWYISYTRDPYSLNTNITNASTLSDYEDDVTPNDEYATQSEQNDGLFSRCLPQFFCM
ncbi:unnamed protein product [Urochloa decumbens]|uniref:Uncharacterized protein n=1 Tax=Urochloa decumbens TaxID=240449 RepID=A0ABC9AME8_9POAL